jgi:hypothetical protein
MPDRSFHKSVIGSVVAGLMSLSSMTAFVAPLAATTVIATGGLLLTVGVAKATNTVPGVGTVIKKKPGDGPVARGVSDKNGVFRANLAPGQYSVTVGNNAPQDFEVPTGARGVSVTVKGEKHNYVGHVTLLR